MTIFGSQKTSLYKCINNERVSWAGSCVPRYNVFNEHGQTLVADNSNNIYALYSHKYDKHSQYKPLWTRKQDCYILAYWDHEKLRANINAKFNQRGFVLCQKNKKNVYDKLYFGKSIDFQTWMTAFKKGYIFFDSGMYQGNRRNYSLWRGSQSFWYSLIDYEFS
jgi:hypothetical protein